MLIVGFPISKFDMDRISECDGHMEISLYRKYYVDGFDLDYTNENTHEEVIAGLKEVVPYLTTVRDLTLSSSYNGVL